MGLLAAFRFRLRALMRPEAFARELKEEIDFHLSLETMQTERAARGAPTRRMPRGGDSETSRTTPRRRER